MNEYWGNVMMVPVFFATATFLCLITASHAMEDKPPQMTCMIDEYIAKALKQAQYLADNKPDASQDQWNLVYGILDPMLDPLSLSDAEKLKKITAAITCIDDLWRQAKAKKICPRNPFIGQERASMEARSHETLPSETSAWVSALQGGRRLSSHQVGSGCIGKKRGSSIIQKSKSEPFAN